MRNKKQVSADCIAMPFNSMGPRMLKGSLHSLAGSVQVELSILVIIGQLGGQ